MSIIDSPSDPVIVDWHLDPTIAELRALREAAQTRSGNIAQTRTLPSKKVLLRVVDQLTQTLFPARLGTRRMSQAGVDRFVGNTLDAACSQLYEQVTLELSYRSQGGLDQDGIRQNAVTIVRQLAKTLPTIRRLLETDLRAAFSGDPAAQSPEEILACYPGFAAVASHRIAHCLHVSGAPLSARIIAENAHGLTGIDIHPGAEIGDSFFIDHGTGVVIGETTRIGQRVRLYHGVTLGAKRITLDDDGRLVRSVARHPTVEDDVVVYAGATILGAVTIGRGSVIGGNVWITSNIPPGSVVTQARTRSESFDSGSGI